MRKLYLECKMGASGDMLMGALFDLLEQNQQEEFLKKMNLLFPDTIIISAKQEQKCGITGTAMTVLCNNVEETEHSCCDHKHDCEHTHAHTHASYADVLSQISDLPVSDRVRLDAACVYEKIGKAESSVHNCSLKDIHFHEVGTLDAIADVIGVCLLVEMLGVRNILVSPIHVGNGTVRCAHGTLPVPAPATTLLLNGLSYYTGDIAFELCTPTGAALLSYFAKPVASMPVLAIEKVGYGLGKKDFEVANMLRAFCGYDNTDNEDHILELSCNLDDMTGEELGYAMEVLLQEGALDVFYQAIQMKKNRPGVLLKCFCKTKDKEKFTELMFLHTTTRGIRFQSYDRATMTAFFEEVPTPYGMVRKKVNIGYGVTKSKYEYEDLAKIAREQGVSVLELKRNID